MKKQIAVLMAAATAVTTVAPALASADVNTYDASVSEINAKIKAALNERYKDKTQDGIHVSRANNVDDYMNSRYAVIIYSSENIASSSNGIKKFADSGYNNSNKILGALNVGSESNENVFGEEKEVDASNLYVVTDATKAQGVIEGQVIGTTDANLKVAIVDKGIKDGSATQTIPSKYYVTNIDNSITKEDDQVLLSELATDLAKSKNNLGATYVDTLKVNGADTTVVDSKGTPSPAIPDSVYEIKLTLKSGKEYTIKNYDQAFDLSKALNDKKKLTLGNDVKQNVYDQVTGFEYEETKDGKDITTLLPAGDVNVYDVKNVEATTIELGKIFTSKDGYTKNGADFVNGIIDARNDKDGSFNFNGKNYKFINDYKSDDTSVNPPVIEASGDGYVLRYNVIAENTNDNLGQVTLQFVIKGDNQKDLSTVLSDLMQTNSVVAGYFTRLEGADRYATAVAVSQEKYDNNEKADTVVIVGGEALMDGLSAAPLAAAKNAPILLANPKTGLDKETLKEINRVCEDLNRKTVYVVGGENSVPEKVVKQLRDEFGVVVERVSGSDRYDTSLEVAKKMKNEKIIDQSTLFITGGEGAADAMSISPVAATPVKSETPASPETPVSPGTPVSSGTTAAPETEEKSSDPKTGQGTKNELEFGNGNVTPILVVPKDSIKRSTRDFINEFKSNKYIIGGESTVSSAVYRDIVSSNDNKSYVERIAGSDRFDTNTEIINKFYKEGAEISTPITVQGAIFASGENRALVDSLSASGLAIKAKQSAPIVLAGSKLTDDQVDLLKNGGLLSGLKTNIYQVGGSVSSDVMSVVVDKLGL